MDLVKTLLVYMTVLLTSGASLSPALTPMPANYSTATPTAIVSPAPTFSYQPPVTATPATPTPAMATLYVGDRGQNVRTMQTRLKELGYLTGTVDGIFGKDTLRAVERFQKYNNLSVDGIAGSKTLNKLYNDRNVVFAPVDVTAPPTRTPATANVPVYYVAQTGERLYTEVLTLAQGKTTLQANNSRVGTGYTLISAARVTVTVSANGTPNPAAVTFTYAKQAEKPPVKAQVVVNYLDESNKKLNQELLELPEGTSTVTAKDSMVPAGYTLLSVRSAVVTVSANGTAKPAALSFVYRKADVSVMVPVNYVDTKGKSLGSDQVNLGPGSHPVIANDGMVPTGYTLQGENTQTVVVDKEGNATPPAVTFTYKEPATAKVPVSYKDSEGKLIHEEVQQLSQGSTTINANFALVPENYTLVGQGSYLVEVDENGVATPAEVTFIFEAPPVITPTPTPAVTEKPTETPTEAPTQTPTEAPTEAPTETPTEAPTEKPVEAPLSEVPLLPEYQTLRFKDGVYPVYTGPGTDYYRVGKAEVGGGQCRLYGSTGDWILIGYGTSGGDYRLGFITKDALPDGITTKELELGQVTRTLSEDARINDDPIINNKPFGKLVKGTQVTLLAFLSDSPYYVYVEASNYEGSTPVRGFVLKSNFK